MDRRIDHRIDRRCFALASLPALLLGGCRSSETPARDATLVHNREIGAAVSSLDASVNMVEMRLSGFGPENWRDQVATLQTALIRLRGDMDELKRALGYADPGEHESGGEHSQ